MKQRTRRPRLVAIRVGALAVFLVGAKAAFATKPVCIDREDRQRTTKTYADLASRFDPQAAAQEFIDVSAALDDLKDQVQACPKKPADRDQQDCAALRERYDAKLAEREAAVARLNAAVDLGEYLRTLKAKLDRPPCEN